MNFWSKKWQHFWLVLDTNSIKKTDKQKLAQLSNDSL